MLNPFMEAPGLPRASHGFATPVDDKRTSILPWTGSIMRHAVLSISFLFVFMLLNDPEVIAISQLGTVAWYPGTGLALAIMLGVNPLYAFLVSFAGALAGIVIYQQPVLTISGTVGAIGIAFIYASAAYVLRHPYRIDIGLRHRRDVMRYIAVTTVAALASTVIGVTCLVADHAISWGEYRRASLGWFFGDEIGILGVAPFLLIHVVPWVRKQMSPGEVGIRQWRSSDTSVTVGGIVEAVAQAVILALVIWWMFGVGKRFYVSFIPIIWIAMRHGVRRVVTGLLAFNFGTVIALHFYPPTADLLASVGPMMFVLSAAGLIVGSEVSERERIGATLLEQATYLDSLIQNSPLGIVALDLDGRIRLTNEAFRELFLYEPGEVLSKTLSELFPEEAQPDKPSILPELTSSGTAAKHSIRRQRKDGKTLSLELHTVPLITDGRRQGSYTIYRDISPQIKAEEDLRREKEDSEIVFDSVPSVLAGVDGESKITRWNQAAETTFGLAKSDVVGRPFADIGIQWSRSDVAKIIASCVAERKEGRLEELTFVRGQQNRIAGLSTKWVSFPGREDGELLIVGADITERRELEDQLQQSQKLEAIGRLAAGIAHEINTPAQFIGDNTHFLKTSWSSIQGVLSTSQRLCEEARGGNLSGETLAEFEQRSTDADIQYLTEEIPRALDQSLEGIDRVTKIVRAMKEFSHPGSKEKEPVNINRAIDTTVSVARNEWKYVAELETDFASDLPLVPCFAGEFNQLVLILLVNAAHAIGDVVGNTGVKGRITISTRQDGDWVEIAVQDTGPGIPEAIRGRIFDPFFTTKPVGKGTGQGLTLAYATVVKKHGGKIWFDSEEKKGTTFRVRLPL